MKFHPKVLFLITAIVCSFSVVSDLYKGEEYDNTFWIALLWVFMGFGLWYYGDEMFKENK